MSATFQLNQDFNTDLASTTNTSWIVNMVSIDSSNCVYTDNPIGRPEDSTIKYSYEAWVYLYMTKAPETKVENFKYWGPNVNPAAGVILWCTALSTSSAATPVNTNSICNSSAGPHNTPGTAILMRHTCSQIASVSGYLVLQLGVDSSAAIGAITGETMVQHISYDES